MASLQPLPPDAGGATAPGPATAAAAAAPALAASRLSRALLRLLAVVSLGVGFVGIFVPGLPTTEFVLLAAWAAARSSPRLHGWILRHRLFGPLLQHWQQGRLPRRAKWAATLTMSLAAVILLLHTGGLTWLAGLLLGSMAAVLGWLWCRPEPDSLMSDRNKELETK